VPKIVRSSLFKTTIKRSIFSIKLRYNPHCGVV
jgi:hypothetical protein